MLNKHARLETRWQSNAVFGSHDRGGASSFSYRHAEVDHQTVRLFSYTNPSKACRVTNYSMRCPDALAGPRKGVPHGYIAQSASDLMLFTNPLIQDTLPPDWESRQAT